MVLYVTTPVVFAESPSVERDQEAQYSIDLVPTGLMAWVLHLGDELQIANSFLAPGYCGLG